VSSRERILDSATELFGQHGYRLTSMELVAQECGLTRQALYHHFDSKEALFRAVVVAVYEGAFEAERAAGLSAEQAGKELGDILVAQLEARFRYLFDRIKGSTQAEELLSEHRRQTQDLHQSFVDRKLSLVVGAIERACAAHHLILRDGMTPREVARCVELAAHGSDLQKADPSQLGDLERSIRLLVAGAVRGTPQLTEPQALRSGP
jgi:AcrR family transcriptional regulator